MTATPSTAFATRVKRARERRGWTQENMADELSSIGWKVDRVQVAKIESQNRKVSLDEAVMIAWVLSLPPAFLYLPVGDEDDVALAPEVIIHPDLARKWALGQQPSATSDQKRRLPSDWRSDMAQWEMFDELHLAQDSETRARLAIRTAEYVGDTEDIKSAKEAHADSLRELATRLQTIEENGLRPPAIPEGMSEAMEQVGVDYEGPLYPGLGED